MRMIINSLSLTNKFVTVLLSKMNSYLVKAKQAEEMISTLKQNVVYLQKTGPSKNRSDVLKNENQSLKAEIENLKWKLMLAEIQNGVKQYYVSSKNQTLKNEIPNNLPNDGIKSKESSQDSHAPESEISKGENSTIVNSKIDIGKKDASKSSSKKGKPSSAEEKMDVSRLDFRVGRIVKAEKHPDADSLYVEEVDVGEPEKRTVVSGLVKHVPIEEMQGRMAIFMCNLKPVKMRGVLSQAMIMCATHGDKTEILDPPDSAVIGDIISADKYPGEADSQLNPKKKIWESLKPDLLTNSDRVATYKGEPLHIAGKGVVKSKNLPNAQIS